MTPPTAPPRPSSPPATAADYAALLAWWRAQAQVLIITHQRPDGDAVGALAGAYGLAQDLGLRAHAYVAEGVPARYQAFTPPGLWVGTAPALAECTAILCLDCARADRLALPANRPLASFGLPSANVDHHFDNPRYGSQVLVDIARAATCELLACLAQQQGIAISPATATALLIGVLTDTGGFRFNNTGPDTLRTAAWLIERGADYPLVMRHLYFSIPLAVRQLEAHLTTNLQFGCGGRFAWFTVDPALLARFGVDERDTEDLVDIARCVAGVEVACRLQQVAEGVRFSWRSINPARPVLPVAQQLGGGGHLLAAGALVPGIDLAAGVTLLQRCAEELFRGA